MEHTHNTPYAYTKSNIAHARTVPIYDTRCTHELPHKHTPAHTHGSPRFECERIWGGERDREIERQRERHGKLETKIEKYRGTEKQSARNETARKLNPQPAGIARPGAEHGAGPGRA